MAPLLSIQEVCERVRLGESAVRGAIRRGELKASRLGNRLRVAPEAVEEWIRERQVRPSVLPTRPLPDVASGSLTALEARRSRLGGRG